jgi:hypothetical protein
MVANNPGNIPNTDYFQNREIISPLVQKFLAPNLYTLKLIPFVPVDAEVIAAYKESYSAYDDPKNIVPPAGQDEDAAWPQVDVTLGEPVSLNTSKRRVKASFKKGVENNPRFMNIVKNTYASMAWAIAYQVNTDLIAELIANKAAATTQFDIKTSGVWDGNSADPVKDIRAIAQDINAKNGYRLDTILVHDTNYYELFDFLEQDDYDYQYVRDQIAPNRNFYDKVIYLKTPGCWVVGLPEGAGMTAGSIIGVGTFQNMPCVENYSYSDPDFAATTIADESIGEANIPLSVNPWNSPDGRSTQVEAWINSKVFVGRPAGIFYKSTGI